MKTPHEEIKFAAPGIVSGPSIIGQGAGAEFNGIGINNYSWRSQMKKRKCIYTALVLLVSIVFLNGCSTTMKLKYTKPAIDTMNRINKGSISVVVNDQRPSEEGKNDHTRVGTIRNTFGVPFPLRADADREPPKVIKELVSDCLKASGYEVVESSNNVAHLYVDLRSFWSDGYQYNKMYMAMITELKNDPNASPVWSYELKSDAAVTWTVGYGQLDKGFTKLLEDAKKKLIAQFESSEFHNRLKAF
jgi:uncharacterized lipoprotein YajG